MRFKYFAGWHFAQAGINASGISYDEKSKTFTRIRAMIEVFELEPNPKNRTEMWNTSVQLWLKECFYDKLLKVVGNGKSFLITFLVSALWHGVHPAYFIGFLHWGLINEVAKGFYRMRANFTWLKNPFRYIVLLFLGNSAISYMGLPVYTLRWGLMVKFYSSFYYSGSIIIFSLFVLFRLVGSKKTKSAKEK